MVSYWCQKAVIKGRCAMFSKRVLLLVWKTSVQINGIAIHIVIIRLYQEVSQFFRAGMVNIGGAGVGSYQHAMTGGKPKIFLPKEASSPILSEKFSRSYLYCHFLQVDLANEIMVHWIMWYLKLLCKVTVYFLFWFAVCLVDLEHGVSLLQHDHGSSGDAVKVD